jgi:hypothetical protein
MILVFIVGIFSIFFVLLLFQNVSFRSQSVKDILLSRVSKYLDVTKGFTQTSSLLSSHAVCYDVAYKGGHSENGTRTWLCNGPWGPSIDDVRFFLGKETLEFLNRYVANYKVIDPMVSLKNFTCVNYNVNQSIVTSGKVDERFDIEALGSKMNVSLGENNVTSKYDLDLEVSRIRFWYMYRIFKKWSETTSLPQDICAGLPLVCSCDPSLSYCSSNCQFFQTHALYYIEKSRQYLESLFNDPENIECTALMDCCMTRITSNTETIEACLTWEDWPCGGCNKEEPKSLCINSILTGKKTEVKPVNIEGKSNPDKARFLQFNVGVSISWKHPCLCQAHEDGHTDECGNVDIASGEPKGTITAMFSCIDKKYSLSV